MLRKPRLDIFGPYEILINDTRVMSKNVLLVLKVYNLSGKLFENIFPGVILKRLGTQNRMEIEILVFTKIFRTHQY